MPGWKGWNESEVRPPALTVVPVMAGFTPINALAPTAGRATEPADIASTADEMQTDAQRKTIASEYLRRGDVDQQDLNGSAARRPATRGKKRAATDTAPSSTKRQKSNVSDSMPVKKTRSSATVAQAPEAKPEKQTSKKRKTSEQPQKASGKRSKKAKAAEDDEQDALEAVAENAVSRPVYAQATSMDAVLSIAQSTSMDALRSSTRPGATIYKPGMTQSGLQQPGIEFTQPWLNNAATKPPTRRASAARMPRLSPVEEEDELDLLFDNLAAQLPPAKPEKTASAPQQLPTPVHSDAASQPTDTTRKQPSRKAKKAPVRAPTIQTEDDDFLIFNESDDEALADAADAAEESAPRKEKTPPPRERKLNMRDVDSHEDYGGALLSDAERQLLAEQKASTQDAIKPVVRRPFPALILDRSPIWGACNTTVLKTCFRIGEAMNVGCQAVRTNRPVLLELYARVTHSWREEKPGRKQHFVFHDLYHDKPPHLNGTFELWDQSKLWELDSRVFLEPREGGVMCRAIARMKREGQKWRLEVLSIWEAEWEDVEYVAGIYAKDGEQNFVDDD